jgi:hypothetical protein
MPESDPSAALDRVRETMALLRRRLSEAEELCREADALLQRLEGSFTAQNVFPDRNVSADQRLFTEAEASGQENLAVARQPLDAASEDEIGDLTETQGALLVAVTMRGGTVASDAFAELAGRLRVEGAALEGLFAGADPHLVRRGNGGAGVSERGLESAAIWRHALAPELLQRAIEL